MSTHFTLLSLDQLFLDIRNISPDRLSQFLYILIVMKPWCICEKKVQLLSNVSDFEYRFTRLVDEVLHIKAEFELILQICLSHALAFESGIHQQLKRFGHGFIIHRDPNLIVSREGTIFAFPGERLGGQSDAAKGSLVLKRSFDNGKTWGDTEVLRHDMNPRISYGFSSGVADLETGRVSVFFGLRVVILPEDIGGQWPEKWEAENPDARRELEQKLAPDVTSGPPLSRGD